MRLIIPVVNPFIFLRLDFSCHLSIHVFVHGESELWNLFKGEKYLDGDGPLKIR